jgi:hypothetical protein
LNRHFFTKGKAMWQSFTGEATALHGHHCTC